VAVNIVIGFKIVNIDKEESEVIAVESALLDFMVIAVLKRTVIM
jgi:hypothetical protein